VWYFFLVPREAGSAGVYLFRKIRRGGADGGSSGDPTGGDSYAKIPHRLSRTARQQRLGLQAVLPLPLRLELPGLWPRLRSLLQLRPGRRPQWRNSCRRRTKFPLAVIDTDDLEAMEKRIVAAGGRITLPIFSFPGGRRFHFTDPSGNELAVMQKE